MIQDNLTNNALKSVIYTKEDSSKLKIASPVISIGVCFVPEGDFARTFLVRIVWKYLRVEVDELRKRVESIPMQNLKRLEEGLVGGSILTLKLGT